MIDINQFLKKFNIISGLNLTEINKVIENISQNIEKVNEYENQNIQEHIIYKRDSHKNIDMFDLDLLNLQLFSKIYDLHAPLMTGYKSTLFTGIRKSYSNIFDTPSTYYLNRVNELITIKDDLNNLSHQFGKIRVLNILEDAMGEDTTLILDLPEQYLHYFHYLNLIKELIKYPAKVIIFTQSNDIFKIIKNDEQLQYQELEEIRQSDKEKEIGISRKLRLLTI